MGTILATGFISGGKALQDIEIIGTAELSIFSEAFSQAICQRGKVKEGEKTLYDVAAPVSDSLKASARLGASLETALGETFSVAQKGLEDTKGMIAQHGKAAAFREKTLGIPDAGAYLLYLLIKASNNFINNNIRA